MVPPPDFNRDNAGSQDRTGDNDQGGSSFAAVSWSALAQAPDLAAFSNAWLKLVCRSLPEARRALLLLKDAAGDGPPLTALWSRGDGEEEKQRAVERLAALADPVLSAGRVMVEGADDPSAEAVFIGFPLIFGAQVSGALLLEQAPRDVKAVRESIRHIEWSAGWVGAYLQQRFAARGADASGRALFLLDTMGAVLAGKRLEDAARALANALRKRFDADIVAIGRVKDHRTKLIATAQMAVFNPHSSLATLLAQAGDEAADQMRALAVPAPAGLELALSAHEALLRESRGDCALSLPMAVAGEVTGTLTLVRRTPFLQSDIDLLDAIAAAFAAILQEKALNSRPLVAVIADHGRDALAALIGAKYLGVKVMSGVLIIAILLAATLTSGTFVRVRGEVQGEIRRVIAAPFDGYIKTERARAGDVVRTGTVVAELQDNDQTLDRLRHLGQKRQYESEADRALARRDLAAANIARAQVAQTDAALALDDEMIGRAALRAPFDAIIVKGDLSQSVGKPVSRGELLFEVAPLDRYRIVLNVPESDVRLIGNGQAGVLLLEALPDLTLPFRIRSITPVTKAQEGQNAFEAIAVLEAQDERIRPGMQGVARISTEPRSYLWIWTRSFMAWLRVKLWVYAP